MLLETVTVCAPWLVALVIPLPSIVGLATGLKTNNIDFLMNLIINLNVVELIVKDLWV